MITDVISEAEFRRIIAIWFLKYDRGAVPPEGAGVDEYCESFSLPETDLIHTQSFADSENNLITLLKGSYSLRDWETRSGKKSERITFYKVMKTFGDTPDVEPIPVGYIIVD